MTHPASPSQLMLHRLLLSTLAEVDMRNEYASRSSLVRSIVTLKQEHVHVTCRYM